MASRSSGAAGFAAAAAIALAGCETHDVEVESFRIRATVDGAPVETLAADPTYHVVFGTAEVLAPTSLRLPAAILGTGEPFGEVVLSFDGAAAPDAVFDPSLAGAPVRAILLADPASTGADGEPLPVPGFWIATGAAPDFRHRIFLWEATYASADGIPAVLPPTGIDVPDFLVEAVYAAWEPAECGLVYYDVLNMAGDSGQEPLEHGETGRVTVGTGEPAWSVLHVQSWHRDGACEGQSLAFSQLAGWRPPAAAPP